MFSLLCARVDLLNTFNTESCSTYFELWYMIDCFMLYAVFGQFFNHITAIFASQVSNSLTLTYLIPKDKSKLIGGWTTAVVCNRNFNIKKSYNIHVVMNNESCGWSFPHVWFDSKNIYSLKKKYEPFTCLSNFKFTKFKKPINLVYEMSFIY